MAFVWMDREGAEIRVAWQSGAKPTKEKRFTDRAEAEAFADKKMGRTGSITSTLDMTPDQLAAWQQKQARMRARWEETA